MVQGFYTLDEAAKVLGKSADELNRMAQRRELRAFADRGTWRFRTQDVDELAKALGAGPASGSTKPKTKTGAGTPGPASSFDDDLIPIDDDIFGAAESLPSGSSAVGLGDDVPLTPSVSKPPSSGSGKKSDSDLRLVLEKGSFDFDLTPESSGRLGAEPPASGTRKTQASFAPPPSSGRLGSGGDSDVRLDFDGSTIDDSMINVGGPKPDSDVRLSPSDSDKHSPSGDDFSLQTEEIDLDAEIQQANEASMKRLGDAPKLAPNKTRAVPPAKGTMLPASSPFELSESDLDMGSQPGSQDSGSGDTGGSADRLMGSEFELTLAPEDSLSPLSLGDDEDVDLGGMPPKSDMPSSARAELSGINLHDPADSGLSLEGDSDDSVDFELTLDDDSSGPKTIKGKLPVGSDSEFELTLDDSNPSMSGRHSGVGSGSASTEEQKDIFETDFDLPALEDESASQAVALDEGDTDLESSDFDLAVDSGVLAHGDESGSQVVTLEEDEVRSPSGRRLGSSAVASDAEIGSVDEMLLEDLSGAEEEFEDEEDEDELAAATVPAAEAEWHTLDVVGLMACVMFMFVSGLMAYELMHGMWGYHQSTKPAGIMVRGIAGLFDDKLPRE